MDVPFEYVAAGFATLSTAIGVQWGVFYRRYIALERANKDKDKQIKELWERVNQLTGDAAAVRGCTMKNCPVKIVEEKTSRIPLLRPIAS
jgi:hypothetical protein